MRSPPLSTNSLYKSLLDIMVWIFQSVIPGASAETLRPPFSVLGKLGPGQLGPGQLGPGQLGPGQLGPRQLGPGAQLSGAQFATFGGRTVGPRTIGPRAHLVFVMIFLMNHEYFL